MVRFSIFGIPVHVQPFFWISTVILGGALDADSPQAILHVGLFVIACFMSVMVHELGHALTARKFGAFSEITLHAFGGFAAYSGVRLTRPQQFLVTAAGPALQIMLGLAVYFLLPLLPALKPDAGYFVVTLMVISIAWALLNLLPILPLDGGRMLDVVLGPQRIKITLWVSIIVAVLGAVSALLYNSKSFIFPIFLGMFAWQAYKALQDHHWR